MAEALYYANNFNAERSQLEAIDSTITRELTAMDKTIEGMSAYWQDEKSAEFYRAAKDLIKEIRKEQSQAISDGNTILSKVEEALKIYEN